MLHLKLCNTCFVCISQQFYQKILQEIKNYTYLYTTFFTGNEVLKIMSKTTGTKKNE